MQKYLLIIIPIVITYNVLVMLSKLIFISEILI